MRDLIRASSLIGYHELVADLGGDPDLILRRFHMDTVPLSRKHHMICFQQFIRMLEATAEELRCEDFGLRLAQIQDFNVLMGPLSFIGLNSASVHEAMSSIIEHMDYYCPAMRVSIDTTSVPELPRINFEISTAYPTKTRQVVEWAVSFINRDIKAWTRGKFRAAHILFQHTSPIRRSIYRRHFDSSVFFEQDTNSVVMKPCDLAQRLVVVDSYLKELATDYVRSSRASCEGDLEHEVKLLLRDVLGGSESNLKQIAKQLSLHERTLQRKLQRRNTTFEDILDGVRREQALIFLCNTNLSVAQVARKLGYAEQTAFNRACRRWFQQTPTSLKRDLRFSGTYKY